MPTPPQHLIDLAHRAHAAGAPAHVLRGYVVDHVQREAAREEAVEHAMALVDALYETPGAPKVRLWTGLASGGAPRVYFPVGYVTVGADGSIGGASIQPGRRRQALTFSESSLYPAQRRAYKKALDLYRAGLLERAEEQAMARAEQIEELVEALDAAVADEEDDEHIERQAERAAWQEAHEGGHGRENPRAPRRNGIEVGDVVGTRTGLTGVVRSFDGNTYTVTWFGGVGTGGGWRASDLTVIRDAAAEKVRRAKSAARKASDVHRALIARVREAAGLPDWHSDEVDEEIARVRAASDLADYRAASRTGAATPLGARAKVAIWSVVRGRENPKGRASDFGFSEREVFYPLAKAQKLAEEAAKGDPSWTYQVTPPEGNSRGLAKVLILDEDGVEIGSL